MRVAVNAQLLQSGSSYRAAGVSSYARNLLTALAAQAGEHRLIVHLNPGASRPADRTSASLSGHDVAASLRQAGHELRYTPLFPQRGALFGRTRRDAPEASSGWPAASPLARILWEQTALPLALRRDRADLVHGLVNVLPLAAAAPGVVTVHDLSFLRLPERFPRLKRLYLAKLCRASVRRARRVIAVSRQTAADLRSFFGVDSRRVEVVYNGVENAFRPLPAAEVAAFRERAGLPPSFLLYLGTLEPRKNLPHLLRAYAGWQAETVAGRGVALVLAGAKGWHYEEIHRQIRAVACPAERSRDMSGPHAKYETYRVGKHGLLILPGFIGNEGLTSGPPDVTPRSQDEELCLWYNAAAAFVYPSLFEGFGLPVLEAMASGAPVICSDAPSLQEVAGDAALIVPAEDRPALQEAFERLFSERQVAATLRARGIGRAKGFTWERAAAQTLELYRDVSGLSG